MLIREVSSPERLENYLRRLVAEGIEKISGGYYSQVFQHPAFSNVVVKVFTGKDRLYWRYLKWCLSHQHNPYVPKIVDAVHVKRPQGSYGIVLMEKVEPLPSARRFVRILRDLLKIKAKTFNVTTKHFTSKSMKQVYRTVDRVVDRKAADKHFSEIWKHIRTYGYDMFDLHHGNAMMRGNQLVIIDPVSGPIDEDHIIIDDVQ